MPPPLLLLPLSLTALAAWIALHAPPGLVSCALRLGCEEHDLPDALLGLVANAFGEDPTRLGHGDEQAIRAYSLMQDQAQGWSEWALSDENVLALNPTEFTTEEGLRLLVFRPPANSNTSTANKPQPPPRLVVYYHGGGCVHGYANDAIPRAIAMTMGAVVVSVDYALYPARYPRHCEDAYRGLKWAFDNAKSMLGADPSRLMITGVSAGGLLSTCAVGLAHDRGYGHMVALHAPIVPMMSPVLDGDALRVWNTHVLPAKLNVWFWSLYTSNVHACVSDPVCNPVARKEFSRGYPKKTIVAAAQRDVLFAGARAYHENLLRAGLQSRLIPLKGSHVAMAFNNRLYLLLEELSKEF